ncbi:hypothetical protein MRX96_020192 [Rhipicephalus microplus]
MNARGPLFLAPTCDGQPQTRQQQRRTRRDRANMRGADRVVARLFTNSHAPAAPQKPGRETRQARAITVCCACRLQVRDDRRLSHASKDLLRPECGRDRAIIINDIDEL